MQKTLTLVIGVVFALLVTPLVVYAQPVDNPAPRNNTARPDVAQIREQAETRAEVARTSAEQRKEEIMTQVNERQSQIKKEVCERQQQTLANVIPRLSQGATSVKKSMDTVYSRVVGFYENGQLTVENYSELVGNVEVAKANAKAAIATIENQNFTLDCENPNVGQQLDGYRLAVQGAKTVLNDYKMALVDLISEMRAVASLEQDGNSDTQGGEQDQGDNENE